MSFDDLLATVSACTDEAEVLKLARTFLIANPVNLAEKLNRLKKAQPNGPWKYFWHWTVHTGYGEYVVHWCCVRKEFCDGEPRQPFKVFM